ncbi:hypothetical protein EDF66_106214 [Sphingobacterium sp. JUb20]|nr:hypothetical protein [Sphingobacterium sp. JUb21]TCR05745.1 hypothetical protein EDF66_106214 [Sphingobacterium sp. JUb20]
MGIFVRTKSFLNYVCFIFLFLNKLSMSLIIRWIKKFYLITICHIANLYLIEKSLLNYMKMARIVMANIELDFI